MTAGPSPERLLVPLTDGAVAGWRWRNEGAPRLLFCHATGFCASAYGRMLAQVAQTFDVYAVDLRGHGRTTLHADPARLRSWDVYGRDVARLLDEFGGTWTLAGHSCGAVSVMLAARGRTDVDALALIEPVVLEPAYALLAKTPLWRLFADRWPLVRGALARRREFASREAARISYAAKPVFARWAEGVLDDYLQDGLRDRSSGVALACAPEWEAATYRAQAHDFWDAVRRAKARLCVLRTSQRGSTLSEASAHRLRRVDARVTTVSEAGHLLPMQAPEIAARFLVATAQAR